MENKEVLLRVRNVKTYFPIRKGVISERSAMFGQWTILVWMYIAGKRWGW